MSAQQPCSEHQTPALSSTERISLHSSRFSHNANHTLGRRHGMVCSFDKYCKHLFDEDGGYDLVDGVLVSLEMGDPTHNDIVSSIASIIRDQYADRKHSYWPFYESRIHIPPRGLFAWITRISGNETVRRADLAIADVSFSSAATSRSNGTGSDTLRFPLNKNAPRTVVEVTSYSSSRERDLEDKMDEYARRGIQEYIVIDRGRRRGDQKRVIICKLHRGTYKKKYYTGGDTLNCAFFDGYSAADLYIPQDIQAKERREKDLHKSLKDTLNRERSEKRRIRMDSEKHRKESERHRKESERHRKESERHRKESERHRKESENYRKKNEELQQELMRITGQKRKDSGSGCVLDGKSPSTSCKRNKKV